MEKPFDKCLDELSHSVGVSGVLCADNQGLCLGARGKAAAASSGMISALADRAAMLEPGSPDPVILLETDNRLPTFDIEHAGVQSMFPYTGEDIPGMDYFYGQCLIHRNNGITLAVYKSPETS